jgi:putative aldouronate transport system permease protein
MVASLAAGELEEKDRVFLNRELLSAAYPQLLGEHLRGLAYVRAYSTGLSTASYMKVLTDPDIAVGYVNTVLRTVVGTLLTLVMTCLAAYPLSRPYMPYRKELMLFILVTMVFSGGLIPTYMVIKAVGLIDSFWVYVIPTMLTGFNIIIVKNFFQSIPMSLAESARIDGASELGILRRIYVPLSKPVLATVGLWTAVLHWNMWFDALIYVHSRDLQTLPIILRRIVIEGNVDLIEKGLVQVEVMSFTPETMKAATVIVTILPILLVYPFLQRYFVKGILLGSVKE